VAHLCDTASGQFLTDRPVRLSTLSFAPFTRPPPPGLAAGLRRLLQEAAAGGGDGVGGTALPPAGGICLSSGLRLQKLAEHADRFELELVVEAGLGGSLAAKAVAYDFVGAPPGGGACEQLQVGRAGWLSFSFVGFGAPQQVVFQAVMWLGLITHKTPSLTCSVCALFAQVRLKQPALLEADFRFPWPIDSVGASFRVLRSARTLSATLPKDPLWPSDAAWACQLDAERLPAWGDSDRLGIYMSSMLSLPELQGKSRGATLGRHSLGAMYDVKETLQALFVRTLQASPHPLDILEQMHTAFTALFRVPLSPCWLATVHAGVLS
jgi:hypothetical protein